MDASKHFWQWLGGGLRFLLVFLLPGLLLAKPPVQPTPAPAETKAVEPPLEPLPASLLPVLELGAVVAPFGDAVRLASGKQLLPIDPANPADVAAIAKLGEKLDLVLPRLNRPDGAARNGKNPADALRAAATEMQSAFKSIPGMDCEIIPPTDGGTRDADYPALRAMDRANGKTYYLGIRLFPAGERESHLEAFSFAPENAKARILLDGSHLLVGIEHNGKSGKDLAFLNWELIDLTKMPVRLRIRFEADGRDAHRPGATLTDGRKGRD
jgi:hypothetical protein